MAYTVNDSVRIAAFNEAATATSIKFYTSGDVLLASGTLTPPTGTLVSGVANGSYTVSAGAVSGLKLTIAALTGLTLAANGIVAKVKIDLGGTVLAESQGSGTIVDYTTETWDSPAVDILTMKAGYVTP